MVAASQAKQKARQSSIVWLNNLFIDFSDLKKQAHLDFINQNGEKIFC